MDPKAIADGLILYLGLVVLLTFHEFGHAWMAWKCGDDTARLQGRVSLNPLVHIDWVGTVILPLVMIFLPGVGRFLVGWAKPVPVNPHNLRNPKLDDILVTLAGPWMNLLLAVVIMGLARVAQIGGADSFADICTSTARISLMLCFFNLLPIPPLDGSQIMRVLMGMSHEVFFRLSQYGFIILIVVLQIPMVRQLLGSVTQASWLIIAGWFGVKI